MPVGRTMVPAGGSAPPVQSQGPGHTLGRKYRNLVSSHHSASAVVEFESASSVTQLPDVPAPTTTTASVGTTWARSAVPDAKRTSTAVDQRKRAQSRSDTFPTTIEHLLTSLL